MNMENTRQSVKPEFYDNILNYIEEFYEWYINTYNTLKQNYSKLDVMSGGQVQDLNNREHEINNYKIIFENPEYLEKYVINYCALRIVNIVNNLFVDSINNPKVSDDGVTLRSSQIKYAIDFFKLNGYNVENIPENATKLDIFNLVAASVNFDFTPYQELIAEQIKSSNHHINLRDQFEIDTDWFLKQQQESNKNKLQ